MTTCPKCGRLRGDVLDDEDVCFWTGGEDCLERQLAAVTAERDLLLQRLDQTKVVGVTLCANKDVELASAQADNSRLREALEKISLCEDEYDMAAIARAALARGEKEVRDGD